MGTSREIAPNHRGIPAADCLIAAAAGARGFAVLHYDGHFDRLAPILAFESVWIAQAGTISLGPPPPARGTRRAAPGSACFSAAPDIVYATIICA